MKELKLNTALTKDDIELRIGSTSAKGFSLLLYKTARTDIKRLTEVYGNKWKNRHFYDDKKLLCCEISIWDDEIKEWIGRSDVGVESYTEKEKGSYSDSFKRAGFRWGIGLELYQGPFIWLNWEMKQFGDKFKPVGFFSSNLLISEYEVKDGVPYLTILYDGTRVYPSNKDVKKQPTKKPDANKTVMMSKLQEDELNEYVKTLPDKASLALHTEMKAGGITRVRATKLLNRARDIINVKKEEDNKKTVAKLEEATKEVEQDEIPF